MICVSPVSYASLSDTSVRSAVRAYRCTPPWQKTLPVPISEELGTDRRWHNSGLFSTQSPEQSHRVAECSTQVEERSPLLDCSNQIRQERHLHGRSVSWIEQCFEGSKQDSRAPHPQNASEKEDRKPVRELYSEERKEEKLLGFGIFFWLVL